MEVLQSLRDDPQACAVLDDDPIKMRSRAAADYIATLTEAQTVELHGRLCGSARASILHAWVRA